ncbi:macrocin-O-methyltransferase [bacterium (Candidatus Blackallbacteria) CG17_big_fil_post_rev_8_21_14_2_50_48_46]|uniref:Macrocin-O-methyltransferase n=1 Tax=bacterium (Candidatus Blackallbacteria) CG17_big_fil_post_rev_8_21_14_2_50_48_46 TaxID=2014261 RepID=A0A2M7G8Q5_9BACT|nr:MAG: macrocin-O-methyltransferase [bacterium (Candidatus Blackallbacteria) CG18_big_fil_WC_8_21_14_2_50_49_26]PIW18496.1 MAG: macrocin-O-methyltransferase [bacterium (Candidatus Blackallbacteria) CG17_big_fil_post_rev_8_21_14_2_50_48_46]PIW46519.1 MAG: macrocin-O-methyltransferase [bacterium (Candidatus Blackallbacteria) CG13_big_fil_rev_8_21_14_2_50_49_14]
MADLPFDGFKKTGPDQALEQRLAAHCERFQISPLEAIQLFPVLARRQWLKRFLAHSQFFQQTLEVPGDIVELGVFRGLGLMTWANLLETFCVGDRTKTVYGFDNWQGFVEIAPEDGANHEQTHKEVGGFSPAEFYAELKAAIEIFDADRFVPWKDRIKLVEGNIEETVPAFVQAHPGVRFSLVHFDCDLYRPTWAALEAIWPKLSRGGILLFDEYAIKEWPGETQAVDEFLADKPDLSIKTLPWTNVPAGYLVKP